MMLVVQLPDRYRLYHPPRDLTTAIKQFGGYWHRQEMCWEVPNTGWLSWFLFCQGVRGEWLGIEIDPVEDDENLIDLRFLDELN